MTLNEAIERLYALQSKLSAYNHACSLIYYDGATTAPKATAANRGHTLSILSEEIYKLSTGEETVSLLEFLMNTARSCRIRIAASLSFLCVRSGR